MDLTSYDLLPVNETAEPTPSPPYDHHFTSEEEHALRLIILVLGPLSFALSLFVVLTFLAFPEKRKFGAWSLNCMFVVCVAMTELFLVIGAAPGFDALHDEAGEPTVLCLTQAVVFTFFGSGMVWFWFFITVNLFMRMVLTRDINNVALVWVALVISTIMTIPPLALMEFSYEGAWCFISGDVWYLIYLDYYLAMGLCSLAGLVLWSAIMYKIYQSGKILSQLISPLKTAEDVHIQASVTEKRQLFFRQLAFVTVFEIMFIIFFASRVSGTIAGETDYTSWVFHTLMMSSMGLYTFLIFGVKRQNFELWAAKCCCRQGDTSLSSFVSTRGEYERIR